LQRSVFFFIYFILFFFFLWQRLVFAAEYVCVYACYVCVCVCVFFFKCVCGSCGAQVVDTENSRLPSALHLLLMNYLHVS